MKERAGKKTIGDDEQKAATLRLSAHQTKERAVKVAPLPTAVFKPLDAIPRRIDGPSSPPIGITTRGKSAVALAFARAAVAEA